jgi:hypothetical protein
MARALRPSPEAEVAVLAVVQRAQSRLLDRLFALECAARGGRAVAPSVERYRDALREAERWLDQTWEPDVPHAAVVGQALSATKALDREPPSDWGRLLDEALDALGRRGQSRFGIGGDPSLLAAVLRGLDAAEMNAPEWLLTAAAAVLEERRSAEATAELADALARHSSGQPLVSRAVSAVFKGDDSADADAPYARWWLASRRKEVELHLNTRAVDDARLQALVAAEPLDGKAAAMVLEAAARAAGHLVIASTEVLSAARTHIERRLGVSRALYRGGLFALAATLGLIELHTLGHYAADVVGAVNEQPFRQVGAGLLVAALGMCLSGTANAVARAYDKHPPEWARQAEALAVAAAGVIGALVA